MVELVVAGKGRGEAQALAGVEVAAALAEVELGAQGEGVVRERGELGEQGVDVERVAVLLPGLLQGRCQALLAADRLLALGLPRVPGVRVEDRRGVLAGDLGDVVDHGDRLRDRALQGGTAGQVGHLEVFEAVGVGLVLLLDGLGEAEPAVRDDLHEVDGAAAALAEGVPVAQDVHDGRVPAVDLDGELVQQALREGSPAGEALAADLVDLLGGEHLAERLLDRLAEHLAVLEQRVPEDDLLAHGRLDAGKGVLTENDVREEVVARQLGCHGRLVLAVVRPAADQAGLHATGLVAEKRLDGGVAHRVPVAGDLHHGITLGAAERALVVAVEGDLEAGELVAEAVLLVQQGALGERVLADQVAALPRHAADEALGRGLPVDVLVDVPRGDAGVLVARLALGPGEPVAAAGPDRSPVGRERPDVVRDAAAEHIHDVVPVLEEEGMEAALVVDDALELLGVELEGDRAGVGGADAAAEPLGAQPLKDVADVGDVGHESLGLAVLADLGAREAVVDEVLDGVLREQVIVVAHGAALHVFRADLQVVGGEAAVDAALHVGDDGVLVIGVLAFLAGAAEERVVVPVALAVDLELAASVAADD